MNANTKTAWFAYLGALAVLAVLGLIFPYKGHFGLDELPLFGAWFAAGVAVALLVVAKIVGAVLKRGGRYYG